VLFRVFGVLEVDMADRRLAVTAAKPLRLLSALLLRANQWVSDDELREAVWPSGPPASAQGNLKSYVSQLRQWIGPDRIERASGAYRVTLDAGELDTWLFEDLIGRARDVLRRGETTGALAYLAGAMRLWLGKPYGLLETEATLTEVMRLTELRWSARELLGEALLAADRADEAVALLRVMVDEDPLRERTWERLMAALTCLGRRAEALRTYQRARRVLVAELGVEPGPRLRDLHERLLRDDLTVLFR
jgi:DNA-binding SARP family transcriptional activator